MEIKELLAVFVPVVAFLNFLFGTMKLWLKVLILILAGGISWLILGDSETDSKNTYKQSIPIDLMKRVNLYSDIEYIKQEIGVPKDKIDFGEGSYTQYNWDLEGVEIYMTFNDGNPNSIHYILDEKTILDIYSPKGVKLYNRPLGQVTIDYLENHDKTNLSDFLFRVRHVDHGGGSYFIPTRWESYELIGYETAYVALFETDEISCKEDAIKEVLKRKKIKSLTFEEINGLTFHEEGPEAVKPISDMITREELINLPYVETCK